MSIKVLFFAQLKELTGSEVLEIDDVSDTDTLQQQLNEAYPKLAEQSYRIAVDKEIVNENVQLKPGSEIAFLHLFQVDENALMKNL